jgi:hypothetical protein
MWNVSVVTLNNKLNRIRNQITELQAKEKIIAEQKQEAEDAEVMKIIRKHRISAEELQLFNKLKEDEMLHLLKKREQENEQEQMKEEKPVNEELTN